MRLDRDEMALFEAACADEKNIAAQELLNVFAAESALQVLEALPSVPLGMFADLVGHIWNAVEEAKQSERFGAQFVVRSAIG